MELFVSWKTFLTFSDTFVLILQAKSLFYGRIKSYFRPSVLGCLLINYQAQFNICVQLKNEPPFNPCFCQILYVWSETMWCFIQFVADVKKRIICVCVCVGVCVWEREREIARLTYWYRWQLKFCFVWQKKKNWKKVFGDWCCRACQKCEAFQTKRNESGRLVFVTTRKNDDSSTFVASVEDDFSKVLFRIFSLVFENNSLMV